MRPFIQVAALSFAFLSACGIAAQTLPTEIVLSPSGAPHAQGNAPEDTPRLLVYMPARLKTNTGVLVIPGGGYVHLSLPTEGYEIASFLNAAGIPAFVLEYRLGPRYRHPAQLEDAQRAIRYLRANAAQFKLQKIGTIGLSAGGHLASMLSTFPSEGDPAATDAIDRLSARPDFLILAYPVIGAWAWGAEGSLRNIDPDTTHPVLSPRPNIPNPPIDPKALALLQTDLRVTAQTPPTFLVCADDDHTVSSENAVRFYLALKHAGVPAEMHIYAHGGHGFGLAGWDPVDSTWTAHLLDWMRSNGYLDPPAKK